MARHQIIWWNVQRLLSPNDSPLSRALDATPANSWTKPAYKLKLEHLAALLREVSSDTPPAILGLAEVENDRVAQDLLKAVGWTEMRLVEDPAARLAGNDLVIFHDPAILKQSGAAKSHNVHNRYATRDLLEVDFTNSRGASLGVIAAHWPSRRISNSEALRIGLADYTLRLLQERLKYSKDELFTAQGRAKMPSMRSLTERWNRSILLFGDFNDSPFDTSISDVLGAKRTLRSVQDPPRLPKGRGLTAVEHYLQRQFSLFNPSWKLLSDGGGPVGTHYWQGDWYLLDQVILSRGVMSPGTIDYVPDSLALHAPRYVDGPHGRIEVTTATGVPKAFDAAKMDGVSDHLPLTFELDL